MDIFIQAAIDEALEGLREGGVPIGAVLVENGKIIGRGRNRRVQQQDQLMHAEIDCLRHARLTGGYHDTTLYSTLMPCYFCAGAVVQFGIKKVIVGEARSAPAARDFMLSHDVDVLDLDNAECKDMMEDYIHRNPALWDKFLAELNPDLLKPSEPSISIRHHFLPGDIGYITYLHAVLYAPEQGWDHTFYSYVALPLAPFCPAPQLAGAHLDRGKGGSDGGLCGHSKILGKRGITALAAPAPGSVGQGTWQEAGRRGSGFQQGCGILFCVSLDGEHAAGGGRALSIGGLS